MNTPDLSIVVPVHNEEESIGLFFERVLPVLDGTDMAYELVFVDDGSTDATMKVLKSYTESLNLKIISFSRNFGKEAALTAGLEAAAGQAVISIDADLQHPPELIPDMLKLWKEGYDVVIAIRRTRKYDGWVKRFTSKAFYNFFNKLSPTHIPFNAGDYRLMDQQVNHALTLFPERSRFMKGLFASLGFKQAEVNYDCGQRAAGSSSWSFWKLWNFALDGLTSFTSVPLRIWSYVGLFFAALALVYAAVTIIKTIFYGVDVPGYASMLVSILFFSGLQLLSVGILGEYISRIFIEVKQRPIYIIKERIGFDTDDNAS